MENTPPLTSAPVSNWDKSKLVLSGSIVLAALLISGTLFYNNMNGQLGLIGDNQPDPNARVDVSIDDDAMLGNKDAKVTIVEFSDYQCPFCRRFWTDTLPSLKKEYIDTGKARFVYRDFPLSMHPAAQPSALAAECAEEQGKYWEMHDKIFAEQAKQGEGTVSYGVTEIKKWAKEIGLSIDQCLDSSKYQEEVAKDLADGTKAGVSGTPTFYVNGKVLVGAQPFEVFKQLIEEELAR